MEQGYKHFSHPHNLIIHHLPESVQLPCSGCNSPATATVHACWQCNFFLHDQCFRATRSLKHPSHPTHPLTLVPYPTYPSNSFYCNSCQLVGTGFSYSCSDCEFDLHVQCAFSISGLTGFPASYHNSVQEMAPSGWNHSLSHSSTILDPVSVSVHSGYHNPVSTAQDPSSMAQNPPPVSLSEHSAYHNPVATAQDPSMAQNPPPVSLSDHSGYHNPVATAQAPSSMAQNPPLVSLSVHSGFHNPVATAQDQNPPPVSFSDHSGYHNPVATAQAPSSMVQNPPPVSLSDHSSYHNPVATAQYPSMAQNPPLVSFSDHSGYHNPVATAQDLSSTAQNPPPVSISAGSEGPTVQYPSIYAPNPIPNTQNSNNHLESGKNGSKTEGVLHFSHPHQLLLVESQDGEKQVACSGCEEPLNGKKGYSCPKPKCDFHLHESCFLLKTEIRHESHPNHPLTLLASPQFTCDACFSNGTGFTYQCSACDFDLHVQCVSLAPTMKRADHEHELKLLYSGPVKGEGCAFTCDVCRGVVQKDRWTYYCETCDYGTHLGCVDCEKCEGESVESVVDTQVQLQRLQLQMEMVRQNAQMMASMGASLANMV